MDQKEKLMTRQEKNEQWRNQLISTFIIFENTIGDLKKLGVYVFETDDLTDLVFTVEPDSSISTDEHQIMLLKEACKNVHSELNIIRGHLRSAGIFLYSYSDHRTGKSGTIVCGVKKENLSITVTISPK